MSDEARRILLESARKAGEGYVSVRGVDLLAALGEPSTNQKPTPASPSQPTEKKVS